MKHFVGKVGNDILAFTSIFDSIVDLVFLMKKDGNSFRYIYVNEAGLKVLNLKEDMIGRQMEDVVSERLAKVLKDIYLKVTSTQNPINFVEEIQTGNQKFIGEASLSPIKLKDRPCEYVLAIVRDITKREQKEKELNETKKELERNQKRLNSLIEHNSDAVFEFDLEGNFVSVNRKAIELTGYETNDLIGTSFAPLIVGEYLEETTLHFNKALAGNNEMYETWIIHKTGKMVQLFVKNIPIFIDGKLDGVYGIASDITEVNRAKEALIKTNEELNAFWNFTIDPVFFFSHGKILKVNPAFEKTFGYFENEIMENKQLIFPKDYLDEMEVIDDKIYRGQAITLHETTRVTKGGNTLNIIASYTPVVDKNGVVVGATAFYKDITELKQTENKLKKSQEKYRLISENAFDLINIIETTGIVTYVSPSNERILGFCASEFIISLQKTSTSRNV